MVTPNAKYPTLSTIANSLVVIGWTLAVVGAIAFLYGLVTINRMSGVMTLVSGLIAVMCGLLGTAVGEAVGVAFDIEQNTRTLSTVGRTPERAR